MSAETTNPVDAVLLDDYGKPIGQLVVSMGGPTAVEKADTSVEDAQRDALEDNASNLPGIEPHEIAEYYPGYDDPEKRERAKRLMLIEGKTVADITAAVLVPERTVLMWVANYKWAEARRRDIQARDDISRMELAETRIVKRNKVFKEQLEQAEHLRNKAIEAINREQASVKSGTEAWAAAAKTEQTILGLSEAGKVASADGKDDEDEDKGRKSGKDPLVVVIQGGGLPPIRRAQ